MNQTASRIDMGDSEAIRGTGRGCPSPSFAAFSISATTITTRASAQTSVNNRRRQSLLAGVLRQFSPLRQTGSADDDLDRVHDCQFQLRRHQHERSRRKLLDRNIPEQRPHAKSQPRSTNQGDIAVRSASKPWRVSLDRKSVSSDGFPPALSMTREKFEALPPAIQRKCFSTSERLRIVRNPEYNNELDPPGQDRLDCPLAVLSLDDQDQQPTLKLGFGQDELANAPHRRIQAQNKPSRIDACPGKRALKRYQSSNDVLSVQRARKSVILDATEESILRLGTRQPQIAGPERRPTSATDCRSKRDMMVSFSADNPPTTAEPDLVAEAATTTSADSMMASISWLEDGEDLDSRLVLDDYHFDHDHRNAPAPTKRDPPFRRRLSISKLPFGNRSSMMMSRPATRNVSARNSVATATPHTCAPGSPVQGHARRRSRALSLITSNRQPVPDALTFVDPAAAHYQDPDARMKLRVYLASAHKFDEAIEFGFPSLGEAQGKGLPKCHKRAASQQERCSSPLDRLLPSTQDDVNATYSDDEASATDPESPRTPETVEKHLPMEPGQGSRDGESYYSTLDYAQAPATSREMTLRMTLTRPDLRADDEQMYGWQKISPGRKSSSLIKDEPYSPASSLRAADHSKESIERQFAAMDQEDLLANDDGLVKRFWNRVRRA
ncbi:hypothetical protein E4U41_002979 [Claviceps citrina]|nr:hypothetical protein E4U41_002979 [Claviceps citrina]